MRLATLERLKFPNVSVKIMADILQSLGINPQVAMEAAGLSEEILSDPKGKITGAQELAFQRSFVSLTPNKYDVWLLTGARFNILAYGKIGLAMATASNLGQAVEINVKLDDFLYTLMRFRPTFDEDGLPGTEMDSSEIPDDLVLFSMLRDLTSVVRANNDLWGGVFPYHRFELALPESFRRFIEPYIPAPLIFNAKRTAWFWGSDINLSRLSLSNEYLHEETVSQLESIISASQSGSDIADRVARLLIAKKMQFSLHEAALALGFSNRTLQRRLGEKGLNFRRFNQAVRQKMATHLLLTTKLSIEAIAWEVGYSDLSAFTHAFRRAFGESPSGFRRLNEKRTLVSVEPQDAEDWRIFSQSCSAKKS